MIDKKLNAVPVKTVMVVQTDLILTCITIIIVISKQSKIDTSGFHRLSKNLK